MPGLSNIFGSDDSESSNDSNFSNDLVGDVNSTLGLDASNSSTSTETDEDGSSESTTSDQDFSLDTSTDGLLGSITDAFSSSDQSSDN